MAAPRRKSDRKARTPKRAGATTAARAKELPVVEVDPDDETALEAVAEEIAAAVLGATLKLASEKARGLRAKAAARKVRRTDKRPKSRSR